jgi:hypothetical protein
MKIFQVFDTPFVPSEHGQQVAHAILCTYTSDKITFSFKYLYKIPALPQSSGPIAAQLRETIFCRKRWQTV